MAEGGSGQKEANLGVLDSRTTRVVEGSFVRPTGQTQPTVEGGKQLVPQQGNDQENNWFEQDMPYEELVGNIRRLVEQAREQHRRGYKWGSFDTRLPFEPAEWLGWHLRKEAGHERKAQLQLMDLQTAWDALYYDRYPAEGGEWSKWVRDELEIRASERKPPSITLPPKSVTLLDAMAEAAGLPRKRGEATIDLSSFATPSGNIPHQIARK